MSNSLLKLNFIEQIIIIMGKECLYLKFAFYFGLGVVFLVLQCFRSQQLSYYSLNVFMFFYHLLVVALDLMDSAGSNSFTNESKNFVEPAALLI